MTILATAAKKTPDADGLYRAYTTAEVKDAKDADRTVEHAITVRIVDRDGDVVEPTGMRAEAYRRNPIVLFGHNPWKFPVGKNISLDVRGDRVIAKTKFAGLAQHNEEAETAYRLVRDGFLRGWSIGFKPITMSQDRALPDQDGIWFKEWELMEYSLVPIPSNPQALTQRAKAYGEAALAALRLEAPSDMEMVKSLIGEAFDRAAPHLWTPPRPVRPPVPPPDLELISLAWDLARVRAHLSCQAGQFFFYDAGSRQAYERRLDRSITRVLGTIAQKQAARRALAVAIQDAVNYPRTVL